MVSQLTTLVLGAVTGDADESSSSASMLGEGGTDMDAGSVLLDALPMPAFVISATGVATGWNEAAERAFGIPKEKIIGASEEDATSMVSYDDDRAEKTLAHKVVDAPDTAHENDPSVERVRGPSGQFFVDERSLENADGERMYISFRALPIYDGDELVAVVELVEDKTEAQRQQEATHTLVNEVTSTLEQIGEGNLDARAELGSETEVLEDELLNIVAEVNRTGDRFESLVDEVESHATDVSNTITTANDAASQIDSRVTEQRKALEAVRDDLASFSAAMEEVAASSTEVESAADRARDNIGSSLDWTVDTRKVTDEVKERSDDLLESVKRLEDDMEEIGDVVGLISEIADRTNILALNANIEAARAGEAGEGFAVVAEEVKSLANETQSHTEQITERIDRIQSRADETVTLVEETHKDVGRADDAIDKTVSSLQEASDAVEEAADGVSELSRASDDQAESVEGVVSAVEDVSDDAAEIEESVDDIVSVTQTQRDSAGELGTMIDGLSK
ncbi:methyl-accepting chemotaxis protein [Halogeometricum borinquense DSM 11551]|uniref:Methyl-accepting chemotaxis protein n=2 Tax=Halogeometricum borinquense TaxID=60847 RepID=E4NSY5_HALBP|nr:methyl-accepting chemotaxis protein [Halogeometricum borinquense]ADQ66978.1 methyl-accepting chemotaxis protein [Halogeometricum borinquense DSM 11551]ELY30059.1 methyl-accepting chemotaxis protein [Halogeometricum borinquense DSM 11551]RYJ14143.1 PAS domain-containing protein [Halogeometricum borinquense]